MNLPFVPLDPAALALATGAAGLLVIGGVLLRSGGRASRASAEEDDLSQDNSLRPDGSSAPSFYTVASASGSPQAYEKQEFSDPRNAGSTSATTRTTSSSKASREELERSLRIAEQALAVATAQLAEAATERESHRAEAISMRQRLERKLLAIEAESQRMSTELEESRTRVSELEQASAREREEWAAARPTVDTELSKAREQELEDLRGQLAETAAQRDAATARVETVERLMEGVRARSRELAEELKTLKASSGA